MSKYILSFDVGIRNLACCLLEIRPCSSSSQRYETPWSNIVLQQWKILNLMEEKPERKCSKTPIETLTRQLFQLLHDKHDMLTMGNTVRTILIERQPLRVRRSGNMRMNFIQQALFDYYTLFRYPEQPFQVILISPTYKLKCDLSTPYIWVPPTQRQKVTSTTKTYAQRKKKSIQLTTDLLKRITVPLGKSPFHQSKKKDDYADCFLQAIYYIQNHSSQFIGS